MKPDKIEKFIVLHFRELGGKKMNKIVLVEQEKKGSFEIRENDVILAELNFNKINGEKIDAYHTFVDSSLRGQGIAEKLYAELMKYAKEKGYKIVPTCSYIEKRIQKDVDMIATK